MDKPTYEELLAALREVTYQAKMASAWIPHVLLLGAIEQAEDVLKRLDDSRKEKP